MKVIIPRKFIFSYLFFFTSISLSLSISFTMQSSSRLKSTMSIVGATRRGRSSSSLAFYVIIQEIRDINYFSKQVRYFSLLRSFFTCDYSRVWPCSSRYQSLQLFVESSILKYPSLCSLMLYHNVCSDSNRNKSNIESSTFSSYVLENIETCSVW